MILSLLFAFASVTAIDVFELNAPKIFAKFAAEKLEEKGHAVLSDGSLRDPMMLSNTLKEVKKILSLHVQLFLRSRKCPRPHCTSSGNP